jgi:hypothetical protein
MMGYRVGELVNLRAEDGICGYSSYAQVWLVTHGISGIVYYELFVGR